MNFLICITIISLMPFVYNAKKCPDISPVPNFDYNKFVNIPWHLVYIDYQNDFGFYHGKKCVTDEFMFSNDTKNGFQARTNSIKFGVNDSEVTYAEWGKPIQGAILFHHNSTYYSEEDFRIVSTDYKDYVVAVSCGHSSDNKKRRLSKFLLISYMQNVDLYFLLLL